jgi:hypothetical protein
MRHSLQLQLTMTALPGPRHAIRCLVSLAAGSWGFCIGGAGSCIQRMQLPGVDALERAVTSATVVIDF